MAKKPQASTANCAPSKLDVNERFMTVENIEEIRTSKSKDDTLKVLDKMNAKALAEPTVRAALAIQRFEGDYLNVNALVNELRTQVGEMQRNNLGRSEAMLIAQAHTLDALFSNLTRRSRDNSEAGYLDAAETYLRLALKAQSQCRATLETLSAVKNPPVIYAKQVNQTTGPQQINNSMAPPPQAREIGNEQSKLLDARATGEAIPSYSTLETVGKIDRAEVPRG